MIPQYIQWTIDPSTYTMDHPDFIAYSFMEKSIGLKTWVGINGTTAKSRKRKFVPSSQPGPFVVVALSRKSQTKVGTLACFDFL